MPTQTGSIDFTSAGGLKSYAAGQFATQGTVSQMQTAISQNADAIALRATKTEVQQVRPAYASSSTAAGTAAKVATIDPAVTGYALYKGASVAVTFSTANTAATPTLNLNSTGAKQIRSYTGAALSEAEYKWAAGATIDLVYDGTYWRMQDGGSVKRVTAAEASIKVNAENINLKVSKNDVINQINVSTEGAKIQASKVEIDGTAVFSAISSDVDDAITSKGYQTSSQVNSAITSKGYATTTQAQGYATTAKSEAISAAATDATTKANAAQTAATNAANTATDNKLKSYSTTAQANNLYDAKGAAAAVETNSGNLFLGASMADRSTFINNSSKDFSRHFRYYNGSASIHSFSEYSPGVYQDTVTLNNSGNLGIAFARMADEMGLDSTSSYTITCWAKCSKAGMNLAIGLSYYNTSNSWVWRGGTNATAFSAADTWQKFSLTFKPDADTKAICYCFTVAGGTGSETFTIRNCWLEKNAAYDAQTTANAAAPKANAVKRTQRIWYRKSASGAPATPGTASSNWVTKNDDGNDAWTKMHIAINSTHKYIYTCEQYEMANGTVGYTSVLLDNTITVIDGGNIITGSVTANKLNAANINASKTLTVGAMTDAAASTILNSNVLVGGRNLLPKTGSADGYYANTVPSGNNLTTVNDDGECYERSVTSTSANIPMSSNVALVGLESGSEYTLSMMVKSTVTRTFGLQLHKNNNGADGGEYTYQSGVNVAANTWTRLTYSFTGTSDAAVYARLYCAAGTACTVRMRELQLERGNKATDWTPAPEDVESSIIEASKTASNYITADSTGIKIHMSGSTSTYQHQSSTATTYYVNGNKRAEVGASGLKVYVGTTGSESSVAEFGTTARVGSASGPNVYVESGGVSVRDGTTGVVKFSGVAESGYYTRSSSVELDGWNGTALKMMGSASTNDRFIGLESGFNASMSVTNTDSLTDYGSFDGYGFINMNADGLSVNGTTVDMDKQVLPAFLEQSGMVSQSISASANAVTSYTVTFPIPYAASPIVTACFYSTSTAAAFGGLSLSVSVITTTSFTVKIFNNTGTGRTVGIFWIAAPQTTLT